MNLELDIDSSEICGAEKFLDNLTTYNLNT